MNVITATSERVKAHTAHAVNARIHRQTDLQIARAARGGHQAIENRLHELDREWDIERWLETGASSLMLTGLLLSTTVSKRWLFLPVGVAAFLLQHAVQGWCPPLPILRRLGVRTADEINRERQALRVLKGDLQPAHANAHNTLTDAIRVVS